VSGSGLRDPLAAWAAARPDALAYRDELGSLSAAALDALVSAAPPSDGDLVPATMERETVLALLRRWRAGRGAVLHDPSRTAPILPPLPRASPFDDAQLLAVVHTSGTTGTPKPVTISVRAARAAASGVASRLALGPEDVWLACLPLEHVGGLAILFRALWARCAIELRAFEARAISNRLGSGEISLVSVVPTMLHRLVGAPKVRAAIVGGAPLAEPMRWYDAGWPILRSYGASETCAMIALDPPGAAPRGPIPLLPGIEAWTEDGKIAARGPQIEGVWRSSDLGVVSAAGIEIHGRADRVIISGGKKVSLDRVEQALAAHPGVVRALCVGLPDPEGWGELLAAWIELDPARPPAPWKLDGLRPEERPRRFVYGVADAFKLGEAARRALFAGSASRIEVRDPALRAHVALMHPEDR